MTTGWAATTISELAQGRFRLGIGAMPDAWNRDWHDIAYERPVERMRDFVAATRAAWGSRPGAPVRHAGPFYRYREYARFDDPPPWPIPVYLGVTRPRMSELAGEIAEGVIFNSVHTVDWIQEVNWPAIDRGLERAGRAGAGRAAGRAGFDAGVRVYCAISEDEAEAVHLLRRSLVFFLPVLYFHDLLRHAGFGAELERGLAAVAAGDAQAAELAMTDGWCGGSRSPGRRGRCVSSCAATRVWSTGPCSAGRGATRPRSTGSRWSGSSAVSARSATGRAAASGCEPQRSGLC